MVYQPVIGLEIHVELLTKSKLFCGCSNMFAMAQNTNICPVCIGLPGSLPVVNQEAVYQLLRTAIALNLEIPEKSKFDRKNYFYPDMPKNFQISQYDMPFAKKGFMEIETDSGAKKIGITRIHLEEDTGKSVHKGTIDKSEYTYLDYNRSGIPLMEIVTEPDIASAKEASVFLNKLRKILLWIGVSDCKMEEGSLRCDANVSVSADLKLNTKVEIKNMNSFRSVQKALEFEIKRQTECYKKGENIIQETRGWDEEKEITISMRSKEEAHDYRYFFEPDLTQVTVNTETVNELKNKLPELPDYMKKRFVESYGLKINQAEVLTSQRSLADFFERTLKMTGQPEQTANWLCQDILGYLNKNNLKLSQTKLTPDILSRLIQFVNEKKISSGQGKMLLADCFEGKDPEILIKEKNMILINGKDELLSLIKTVINENTEVVSDLKKGEEKKLMFLIGQIMKKTSGKADPKSAKEILLKEIEKT